MLDDVRGYFMMVCYSVIETRVARAMLGCCTILIITFITLRLFGGYINAPRPVIFITSPKADIQLTDKQVLIRGRVIPQDSEVTVNGQKVISNGDGTFSQVVPIVAGMNILKFEAQYYGKKAGTVQTATRLLTEEEKAEQTAALLKEEQKVKADANQIAAATQQSQVLGDATTSPEATASPTLVPSPTPQLDEFVAPAKGMIMTRNEIKKNGEVILSGQFKNVTDKTLRWTKLKAQFKDASGTLVDTKTGVLTLPDQHLAPGAEIEYTMPATTTTFATYDLTVAYEAL